MRLGLSLGLRLGLRLGELGFQGVGVLACLIQFAGHPLQLAAHLPEFGRGGLRALRRRLQLLAGGVELQRGLGHGGVALAPDRGDFILQAACALLRGLGLGGLAGQLLLQRLGGRGAGGRGAQRGDFGMRRAQGLAGGLGLAPGLGGQGGGLCRRGLFGGRLGAGLLQIGAQGAGAVLGFLGPLLERGHALLQLGGADLELALALAGAAGAQHDGGGECQRQPCEGGGRSGAGSGVHRGLAFLEWLERRAGGFRAAPAAGRRQASSSPIRATPA